MNDSVGRTMNFILAGLIAAFAGIAQAANTNATIQEGRININITRQCGGSNDHATYQTGRVNINKTVQGCSKNRTNQQVATHAGENKVRRGIRQPSDPPSKRAKRSKRERTVMRANDYSGDSSFESRM